MRGRKIIIFSSKYFLPPFHGFPPIFWRVSLEFTDLILFLILKHVFFFSHDVL